MKQNLMIFTFMNHPRCEYQKVFKIIWIYIMIGAVLVIYKPNDEKVIENLKILSKQCELIYIHINSKISKNLEHFLNQMKNVEIIFSQRNIGLGKSQNDGIDFFLSKRNFQHIIFFDQDTKISTDCIANMESLISSLRGAGHKVGAIAPTLINAYSSTTYDKYKRIKNFAEVVEVREVMLSGMIIPVSIFEELVNLEKISLWI